MNLGLKFWAGLFHKSVFLVLLLLFAFKSLQAWDKYAEGNTLVVSQETEPHEQTFPSVTACKQLDEDDEMLWDLPDEDGDGDPVIELFYHGSKNNPHSLKEETGRGGDSNVWTKAWRRRREAWAHGLNCVTYDPPIKFPPGYLSQLHLFVSLPTPDVVFYILLHERQQDVFLSNQVHGSSVTVPPYPLPGMQGYMYTTYIIETVQYERLASADKLPCHDRLESNFSLYDCVEKRMQGEIGCRIPWREEQKAGDLATCSTAEQLMALRQGSDRATATAREMEESTGCHYSCRYLKFTSRAIRSQQMAGAEAGNYSGFSLRLNLQLASDGVTVKKEVEAFDFLELAGNVGGYLGLYLGWSALSLVEAAIGRIVDGNVACCFCKKINNMN